MSQDTDAGKGPGWREGTNFPAYRNGPYWDKLEERKKMAGLERDLERKVVKYCKDMNLKCYKFSSPAVRGVPDRIIIGPKGVLFLELKRAGEKPTKLQQFHIREINSARGENIASWADNMGKVVRLINEVCT